VRDESHATDVIVVPLRTGLGLAELMRLALNVGSLRCRNLSGVGGRPDVVADIAKTALLTHKRL
jgi:hypothetical protein